MIHKSDIQGFIRDIEFRWVRRVSGVVISEDGDVAARIVLQYRVQKGDGFRGWSSWEDVKEEDEE